MADKRSHVRYIITDCVILNDESGATIASEAMLSGISFRGMSLELKEKIEVGRVVQFELNTKLLARPLRGKAVVKNITELKHRHGQFFRIGVEFTDVNGRDVTTLLNEIQHKMRQMEKRIIAEDPRDYGPF
ncbi:MAG: PilZ domain-containing protein [Candidatus Omnitrophota bacterium]